MLYGDNAFLGLQGMSQGTSSGEQRAHPKRVLDSEDARPGESSVWGVKRPRTGSANADTIAALAAGALAAQRADSQPAQFGLADGETRSASPCLL